MSEMRSVRVPLPLRGVASVVVLSLGWVMVMHLQAIIAKGESFLHTQMVDAVSERTLLYLAGIGAVILIELPLLGWRDSSLRRLLRPSRTSIQDIVCFLGHTFGLFAAVTTILSLNLAGIIPTLAHRMLPVGWLSFDNPVVQTIWYFLAIDFIKYWFHWLQHRIPFMWEAHKFHHAAEEMNVITTARGHPIDDAFRLIFVGVLATLLGASGIQSAILVFVFALQAGLTHSMLPWTYGWFGRWVVVAPIAHRIHHSELREHFDLNLGANLIIWDRIFGTYYTGDKLNDHIGVENNQYNRHNFVWDMVECARQIGRAAIPTSLRRGLTG